MEVLGLASRIGRRDWQNLHVNPLSISSLVKSEITSRKDWDWNWNIISCGS
jgi:hypothetical protein